MPPFGSKLVVLNSSLQDLSIDTSLETWIDALWEREVVAVFEYLREFWKAVLLFFRAFDFREVPVVFLLELVRQRDLAGYWCYALVLIRSVEVLAAQRKVFQVIQFDRVERLLEDPRSESQLLYYVWSTAGRIFKPVLEVLKPFQPPQTSQQSNLQRFKPLGKQFKRRSNSSYSGSISSGDSVSGGVTCGQCGGRHMTTQCCGVQGLCHNCGQPRHFSRVCLRGAQPLNQ
ncbi:hypothetical protein F511_07779 [Dorcoceras hygrometricum]|uniref:CCHC-type domain-containing protein n=1 Tax=Dorcoceras hygrometricum TaxID=472368 RepID=A0A2Z7AA91_9LAMI|nr:hypothetical protein F511_07779 [Dorcoceras hygrometricum]